MGQALYRKYRSKSLKEIVGQEHITHTLEQALKSGRISHAYLFTGPRGVGKTSIARILAHEINNLPYDETQTHMDIIEIDAASNRRIDEIRDLRDKVYVAPAQAKFKVYIIDEVHMLTKEAFNALLKTLEEPPAHVVFILATTEAHKLPETIVSRTQRFIFRPIDPQKAVKHLKYIAKQEKISVTDDALALIAEHSDGSFRDSIGLLDQASGRAEVIDVQTVYDLLGIPSEQAIVTLRSTLQDNTTGLTTIVSQLSNLYDQGFEAAAIAKQLAAAIRTQIVTQTLPGELAVATRLLSQLLEVPTSHDPERYLEIVLLDFLAKDTASQPQTTFTPAATIAPAAPTPKTPPGKSKAKLKNIEPTTKESATKATASEAANTNLNEASWTEVLNKLKSHHNTLYGLARMARPDFSKPGRLELTFAFVFHQKRLQEAKNWQIISDAVTAVTGQTVEIVCNVDAGLKDKPATKQPAKLPDIKPSSQVTTKASEPLSAISNIFGGGELLES